MSYTDILAIVRRVVSLIMAEYYSNKANNEKMRENTIEPYLS